MLFERHPGYNSKLKAQSERYSKVRNVQQFKAQRERYNEVRKVQRYERYSRIQSTLYSSLVLNAQNSHTACTQRRSCLVRLSAVRSRSLSFPV